MSNFTELWHIFSDEVFFCCILYLDLTIEKKEADLSLMRCLKRFHFVSVEAEDYKFENQNYLWVWSQREASWSDVHNLLLVDATTAATPVLWA